MTGDQNAKPVTTLSRKRKCVYIVGPQGEGGRGISQDSSISKEDVSNIQETLVATNYLEMMGARTDDSGHGKSLPSLLQQSTVKL